MHKLIQLLKCLVVGFLVCSCSQYIQIATVSSTDLSNGKPNYIYDDDNVSVIYNFWGQYGPISFCVQNKTSEDITIDLVSSNIIVNGVANDYFGSLELSSTLGSSMFLSRFTNITSSSSTTKLKMDNRNKVVIPPNSMKVFCKFYIANRVIQDCNINMFENVSNGKQTMTYTIGNTPIEFKNRIAYFVGDSEKTNLIINCFYVSNITNYKISEVSKNEKYGCKLQKNKTIISKEDRKKFFIEYSSNEDNAFSNDTNASNISRNSKYNKQ